MATKPVNTHPSQAFGGPVTLYRGQQEPGPPGKTAGLEPGIDVGLAQGTSIYSNYNAYFRPDLSNARQAVLQLEDSKGNGINLYESFTHVIPLSSLLNSNEAVPVQQGGIIGTVAPAGYTDLGHGSWFYTTAPSIEFSVGQNVTSGSDLLDYSKTIDPYAYVSGNFPSLGSAPIQPTVPVGSPGNSTIGTVTLPNSTTTTSTSSACGSGYFQLASLPVLGPICIPVAPLEHVGLILVLGLAIVIISVLLGGAIIKDSAPKL